LFYSDIIVELRQFICARPDDACLMTDGRREVGNWEIDCARPLFPVFLTAASHHLHNWHALNRRMSIT
jgi:hypothetical protein